MITSRTVVSAVSKSRAIQSRVFDDQIEGAQSMRLPSVVGNFRSLSESVKNVFSLRDSEHREGDEEFEMLMLDG